MNPVDQEEGDANFQSVHGRDRPVWGWATGGVIFAATMMITIGLFQAFQGLVAINNDEFL